ncbi:mitochondrial carrier domain-containing protein [Dichotomocladium elegans]|nr:mitochondrial carrier domain-containing protein [Dichotomocladium elegans]
MSCSKRQAPFYFGGMSSCIAAMAVHPLDLTKVRLQNTKGNSNMGMLRTMATIARIEGPWRLYAGLSASLLRQATYSTVRFGVYEHLKQNSSSKTATVWQLFLYSSVAGALGGACGNPGDVINVRMQNDGQLPPHQRRNYTSAVDGLARMAREEGIKALFRGVGPNVNRAILMTSSQCVSYDIFKDALLRRSILNDGLSLHFTASVLAGLVATTACSPVDVVKTRIMAANSIEHKLTSVTIMSQMYKTEGLRSFFKGWTPAFVRLGPQTIITFVVLEQLKTWHAVFHDRPLIAAKI